MRATQLVIFFRGLGAAGMGSYAGAGIAGLIAVFTGRVFASTSQWPAALPGLSLLGAAFTAGAVMITRKWLFPTLTRRRAVWGAVAGAILIPLAFAVTYLEDLMPVVLLLMFTGWLIAGITWVRWFRSSRNGTLPPQRRAPESNRASTVTQR